LLTEGKVAGFVYLPRTNQDPAALTLSADLVDALDQAVLRPNRNPASDCLGLARSVSVDNVDGSGHRSVIDTIIEEGVGSAAGDDELLQSLSWFHSR